jgi:hypothetical protein
MSTWILDMSGEEGGWIEGPESTNGSPGFAFVPGEGDGGAVEERAVVHAGYTTVTVVDADGGLRLALVPVAS